MKESEMVLYTDSAGRYHWSSPAEDAKSAKAGIGLTLAIIGFPFGLYFGGQINEKYNYGYYYKKRCLEIRRQLEEEKRLK